jgi:acyl-ACP thioesterase
MNKTWSETYQVHTYELDRQQKASVRAICSFLIDTAGQHTHEIGFSIPQLLERKRSWFFSRFLLRMEKYPGWREKITVETWPPGSQRLLALRDWRLFSGQRLIGLATSGWLMIDIQKRRPLRPESYPEWKRFIHPERTIPHVFGKLPELGHEGDRREKQEFRVRFSDVDLNGHANYLAYIDWILEVLTPALKTGGQLTEMEIHFLREANFADEVISRCQLTGNITVHSISGDSSHGETGKEYLHSLARKQDGMELVRARTVWRSVVDP